MQLVPTRNKIIYKTASSDGPNSGFGKLSQNRLRSKRASVALPVDTKTLRFCNPDTTNFKNEPKHGPRNGTAWRRTEEARPDFNWLSGSQKWNLKSHMWYQLSPFPSSNAAIAMQHHPGNIHQSVATPRYSAAPCFNSIIQYNWHGKDGGVREPSMLHLPTSFPKQTLTPSRFKFILLGTQESRRRLWHHSHFPLTITLQYLRVGNSFNQLSSCLMPPRAMGNPSLTPPNSPSAFCTLTTNLLLRPLNKQTAIFASIH